MIDFYIYLHCKPNGDPFYVGKGFGYRSHKFSIRNLHHKRIVAKCGGKANIEVLVFARASEKEAFDDEVAWIHVLREAGYELANKTNGGDGIQGFRHSAETRAKQAISASGRKHSPESIARMTVNNKAGTAEVRAKLSIAHKGKTLTDDHRKRISDSLKGRPGIPLTEESKAKIRLARRNQIFTDETRAKLSVSATADWKKRKANRSAMLRA